MGSLGRSSARRSSHVAPAGAWRACRDPVILTRPDEATGGVKGG